MVRVWTYALLVAGLLLAVRGNLCAQEESPPPDSVYRTEPMLVQGDKVRITAPRLFSDTLVGRVESLFPDTLLVRPKNAAATVVPLSLVSKLAISRGNKQIVGELLGTLFGAMLGGLVASELSPLNSNSNINTNIFTVIGVVAGGMGGYFLGRQFDRRVFGENWEEVPVSRIRWETQRRDWEVRPEFD